MLKKTSAIIFFIFLNLISPDAKAADKLKIVTTFSVLADMIKETGSENVEVITLVGNDSDTHVYQPSPKDVKAITSADLVIINGLNFEPWIEKLVKSAAYKGAVISASAGVKTLSFSNNGTDALPDPHAWQDISNGKIYVKNIRDALINADKKNSAFYIKNTDDYLNELDQLDKWIKTEISKTLKEKRKIITSHDAFQYFGKAYGIEFISPIGISTGAETSAHDFAKFIDQVRREKVTAIFVENISNPNFARQLEKDTGAHIGGTLYSDSLSAPSGPAPTYIKMFKNNTLQLIESMK